MAGERTTTAGDVVFLLAELSQEGQEAVHEIGSRGRVLQVDGERLTLALERGERDAVVTCRRALVARAERSLAARRRELRGG